MKTTTLGRTGLTTTVAGLGAGGFSRLGIKKFGEVHAKGIVRKAYELGVRFFDTATAYGTEAAIGKGLENFPRESYILSTKFPLWGIGDWREGYRQRFAETLDASLKAMKTDYIDVYNIHGVPAEAYGDVKTLLVPEMIKAQETGKIRFLGITEGFVRDTSHKMLGLALDDDIFDVVMVGYNMMNPSAAKTVFPRTIEKNIGVLCMFAVRRALADKSQMKAVLQAILDNGQGGTGLEASEDILDFLVTPDSSGCIPAASIMDAAYRYCAHTAGVHVVLTGTGSESHLADNLRSIEGTKLPRPVLDKLEELFGRSDCVSGQE